MVKHPIFKAVAAITVFAAVAFEGSAAFAQFLPPIFGPQIIVPAPDEDYYYGPRPYHYRRAYGASCDTEAGIVPIRPRPLGSPCHVRVRGYGWLEGETVR